MTTPPLLPFRRPSGIFFAAALLGGALAANAQSAPAGKLAALPKPAHAIIVEWQKANPRKWFDCDTAHSQPLNGNRKAYAAWNLFARLVGWE
jgi:hypothetical protein